MQRCKNFVIGVINIFQRGTYETIKFRVDVRESEQLLCPSLSGTYYDTHRRDSWKAPILTSKSRLFFLLQVNILARLGPEMFGT